VTLLQLVLLFIVAAIVGGIGQALAGFELGGCLISAVVGFIGALLGVWLAGQLGLPEILVIDIGGEAFPIVWSIIGSALFVAVIGLLTRRRVRV
jgi:uncharacterized membrane protein YeaQ/YmgE (transglycosylase-associated protein family)